MRPASGLLQISRKLKKMALTSQLIDMASSPNFKITPAPSQTHTLRLGLNKW